MANMTRIEALCVCKNILDALTALDEILPADFHTGLQTRVSSMMEYITKTPQYPNITDNMDKALRNQWNAVQKWNRKGDANTEMFDGLADMIAGTSPVSPPTPTVEDEIEEAPVLAERTEGLEDESYSRAMLEGLAGGTQVVVNTAAKVLPSKPLEMKPPVVAGNTLEVAAKARENIIATALRRFHEKGIRVIAVEKVKHGDLTPITKMTSSDRNQQLLEAAYLAGQIAGAKSTVEELQELLKK